MYTYVDETKRRGLSLSRSLPPSIDGYMKEKTFDTYIHTYIYMDIVYIYI